MLKECTSNQIPQRLVIAFEMANAEQTPLPLPDISSPSNNFANLSFIISISAQIHREKKKKKIENFEQDIHIILLPVVWLNLVPGKNLQNFFKKI